MSSNCGINGISLVSVLFMKGQSLFLPCLYVSAIHSYASKYTEDFMDTKGKLSLEDFKEDSPWIC